MAAKSNLPRSVEIHSESLEISYDDFVAFRATNLDLKGNIISVIGHNGAGKSTFIKGVLGILKPTKGELHTWSIENGGRYELTPEKHMAFCPEIGAVFSDIPVESYIKLWCRIKHRDAKYYQKAGSRYIEALQVAPLLRKLGRELSKGQRRRVQTAIGFLLKPKLFLFDEPFDGLDVQKTSELADIIREEAGETSFIISSHRMDVVERLSDLLVVLKEGEFFASGSVEAVCEKLCGKSAMVSNMSDPQGLLERIRAHYPECLIGCVGHQISVTGDSFDPQSLSQFLGAHDSHGVRVDEIQPSLVDAMNFHLKSLGAKPRPEFRNGASM